MYSNICSNEIAYIYAYINVCECACVHEREEKRLSLCIRRDISMSNFGKAKIEDLFSENFNPTILLEVKSVM